MPWARANERTSFSGLVTVSPTIVSPFSPYLLWSFTRSGISMRQGPHHVAQKSRITTLPLRSDSRTFLPERSVSSKSGAVDPIAPALAGMEPAPWPFAAPAVFPSVPGRPQPKASKKATAIASAVRMCLEDRIVFLQFVVGDAGAVPVPLDPLVLDEFREHVVAERLLHQLRLLGQLDRLDEASGQASDLELLPLLGVHLVDVLLDRRPERRVSIHPLEARREADREGEIGVAGRIRASELDTGGLLVSGLVHGNPHQGGAVPLAPGDVDRRLEPGHQPLVRIDPLIRDRGELRHVAQEPGQVGAPGLREMVLVAGGEEEVLPAFEERLMDVHAASVLAVDRLRHERGVVPALARDLLHHVAVGDALVRHLERFAVLEVDLVLAGGHLVVGGLHRDLHRLERLDGAGAELGPDIIGHLVEIARVIQQRAIAHALEVEVLELRAQIERVALLLDPLEGALQDVPGVPRVGRAVRILDVADQPAHALAVHFPGEDLERAPVRHRDEIALVDPGEALDGGAVDAHALFERVGQYAERDAHALQLTQNVDEPEMDHLHTAFFAELHDLLRRLQALHPLSPSFNPWRRDHARHVTDAASSPCPAPIGTQTVRRSRACPS